MRVSDVTLNSAMVEERLPAKSLQDACARNTAQPSQGHDGHDGNASKPLRPVPGPAQGKAVTPAVDVAGKAAAVSRVSSASLETLPSEAQALTRTEPEAAAAGAPLRSTPSTAQRDLWERLRSNFTLPAHEDPNITRELRWFVAHPEYWDRIRERALPYLHFIVEEVERRGMPGEVALLPVVESGFQPFAYSPGRAAGIWQFIPATGRLYGLKQNWWYDGRRDIEASTAAALTYLDWLSRKFQGNWLLALAAYNSGSGRVSRAIERNRRKGKATDFWALQLPRETRNYVPRLLAIARLVAQSEHYGVNLQPIPDVPYFARVDTGSQIDLVLAAEMADLTIETLYQLNPAFNRWATDPDGPHRLLLPKDRVAVFKDRLAKLPEEKRLRWKRHRIRKGETLSHIARRYGTTVAVLRQTNKLPGNRIRAGKHLLIPVVAVGFDTDTLSVAQGGHEFMPPAGSRLTYTVQPEDSLWAIAKQHQVKVQRLAAWNGMSPTEVIHPGQRLVIRLNGSTLASAEKTTRGPVDAIRKIRYRVRRGDSLDRISKRFKVSIRELRRWNASALTGRYIQPGQTLTLHVDVTRQTL